jgi:hypothetical protein
MMRYLSACAFVPCLLVPAAAGAAIISVPAGGNLQAAINQAVPGDVIMLAPGATYTGNFVLPAKSGTGWITLRSAAPDSALPAAGRRMTPAYASQLPKLRASNTSGPAMRTAASAHHYVLMFLELLPNPAGTGSMIELGDATRAQSSLAVVPHDLVVDRCYLHGQPGAPQLRGIALNSGATEIRNCYISEIKYAGRDSQAIAGWNGPGPYRIVNNYLEAAGENVLIGGSSMYIPNVTPSNIEVLGNHMAKQTAWRGSSWTVKNIFELKHASNVRVEGNVFEYNWQAAQPGSAIVFTPRNQNGDNPWTVVQNVTFRNNVVKHVAAAINILGVDNNAPSQQTNHIAISNNVFEDVSSTNWGGTGRMVQITGAADITVDHNTVFNNGSAVYAYGSATTGFVFTNNIVSTAKYGIMGDATGEGNGTVTTYFPGSMFAGDLFIGCKVKSSYPGGNYHPATFADVGFVNLAGADYHLATSSPYVRLAIDGTNPGANVDTLVAAVNGGAAPAPAPTPMPTPTPTPTPTPIPPTAGIELRPSDDVTIRGGSQATVNANNSADNLCTRASSNAEYERRILLKFDTSSTIPAGTPIQRAILTLTVKYSNPEPTRTLGAYWITGSFLETEATWLEMRNGSPWRTPGGDLGTRYATASVTNVVGSKVEIDVTRLVADAVGGALPSRWTRIAIKDEGASSRDSYRQFWESEASSANGPVLTITYAR